MEFKNRIKEYRPSVPVSELTPNPLNWRGHPEKQKRVLSAIMKEVGNVNAALAYETKNGLTLIDGHLRTQLAEGATIPVLVLDVTEDEALKILLTHDPITEMAVPDHDLQKQIADSIGFENSELASWAETIVAESQPKVLEGFDNEDATGSDHNAYENTTIRQIILVFNGPQYDLVVDALGEYCEKHGLSNNTEAVVHLLHHGGYFVNPQIAEDTGPETIPGEASESK